MLKKDKIFTSKIFELILYIIVQYFSYFIALKLDLFAGYTAVNYQAYYKTIFPVLLFSVVLIISTGLLSSVNKTKFENVILIVANVTVVNILYMATAFFGRSFAMPRTVIFLGAIIQLVLFIVVKFAFIAAIKWRKQVRDIIILCPEKDKERLIVKLLSSRIYKERLKYCVDPALCTNYMSYVKKCDKVYMADAISSIEKDKLVSHCISADKSLYMIPKTFEIAIFNSNLIQISDIPVFKVDSLYLSAEKLLIKRIFDFSLSLIALLLLSPVMLVVALVLLFTQGRPILFKQKRLTKDNKVFNLYKFRSMNIDAEKVTGPIWAIENDPRVTKVGRFLRRYWLDELPQLINVLKGDMSLVGPRPERPVFTEEFSKAIPDFKYRLSVKAGVTGLAQVLGRYATTPDIKIKYDLIYIKNSSLFYDIKIIFETLKKIVVGTLKRGEFKELDYNTILKKHNYQEKKKNGYSVFSIQK